MQSEGHQMGIAVVTESVQVPQQSMGKVFPHSPVLTLSWVYGLSHLFHEEQWSLFCKSWLYYVSEWHVNHTCPCLSHLLKFLVTMKTPIMTFQNCTLEINRWHCDSSCMSSFYTVHGLDPSPPPFLQSIIVNICSDMTWKLLRKL